MSGELWGNVQPVTLQIPTEGGWIIKTVQAIQVGDLAVHEPIGLDNYKWQVTHVPTLTMFDKAVPEGDWTQEQLLKWCWKVQENTDLWQAICSYDNSNYKTVPESLLEGLKQHCLSIAVE